MRQLLLGGGCTLLAGCGASVPAPALPTQPTVSYGADPLQFGHLRVPGGPGPHPVVVSLHGGFWLSRYGLDYNTDLCVALTNAGWATWNVEYRRLGDAGGGWPGTFHDVARATDYLREIAAAHHLDLKRVVTMGHSAGGQLALWLAARPRIPADSPLHALDPLPIRAVVSLAGVVNLRQANEQALGSGVVARLLGGTPAEVPERYAAASPAELLPLGVSQVLLHGSGDGIVPKEMSRTYAKRAAAKGDDAIFIEVWESDHFELLAPNLPQGQQVLDAINRFKK